MTSRRSTWRPHWEQRRRAAVREGNFSSHSQVIRSLRTNNTKRSRRKCTKKRENDAKGDTKWVDSRGGRRTSVMKAGRPRTPPNGRLLSTVSPTMKARPPAAATHAWAAAATRAGWHSSPLTEVATGWPRRQRRAATRGAPPHDGRRRPLLRRRGHCQCRRSDAVEGAARPAAAAPQCRGRRANRRAVSMRQRGGAWLGRVGRG